ncbi:MAG: heme biosynthesis protein HemY [Alphaproteobacteria bacterium]|nr:heme biosynthesis protein HemY [Alphaproteobacteria bacterium]
MLRALLIFIGLAALGVAGAWLADHPGQIAVQWGGRQIETSTAVAVTALLVLIIIVAAMYRFWRWVASSPMALSSMRSEGRRRKGYQSLSSGLVAVAAGDVGQAKKLAQRTAELLDDPSLTLLLSAQAAQLDGDEAGARAYFQAMRERPETEFLGLRGLLVQATRAGDQAEALSLARRAFALRPDTPWVGQELFSLEAAAGDWAAAQKTLAHTVKRKLLVGVEATRRQAIVLFAQAQAAADRGESKQALELARKAHAQLPEFSPATALAGRLHGAASDLRKARRLLLDGWRKAAHPDILAAWLDIHPSDDPEKRLDAVQTLIVQHEGDDESRMALAKAALDAGEFDTARTQLTALMDGTPTARVARLFSDLEDADDGDVAAARQWLREAARLPSDDTWVCQSCGWQSGAWQPHCPDCGSFDAFVWRQPAGAGAVLAYSPDADEVEAAVEAATEAGVEAGADAKIEILPPSILPPDVEPRSKA